MTQPSADRKVLCGLVAAALLIAVGTEAHADFTPGSLVVSVFGDGGTAAGNKPITLREFTTSGGTTGFSVMLPSVDAGGNYAIVGPVTTASGFLKRSVDGRFLTIVGSGTETPTTKTIARIDAAGAVNTTTHYTAGNTVYSAITTDGTSIWLSAATGNNDTAGIRYLTLGGSTSGARLSYGIGGSGTNAQGEYSIPLNTRVNGIFDNQLYGSALIGVGPSNSYSFRGVYNAGTGLQTSGTLYGKTIVGGGISNSGIIDDPWEFVVVSNSSGQPSVIYVADNDTTAPVTGGVQKWLYNDLSGTWSKLWTVNVASGTGVRALTGLVAGNAVQLYAVTGTSTPTGRTTLVSLADTLDGTLAPTVTPLATADANYAFGGVAFAPVPEPAAVMIGLAGIVTLAAARHSRRRKAGR